MLKKHMIFLIYGVLLLAGCASSPVPRSMMYNRPGNQVEGFQVSIDRFIEFGDRLYQSAHKGQGFTKGFVVTIKNNTQNVGKIEWNNSSISDEDGAHRVFIDGTKYINANEGLPSLVIPPNSKVTKIISSADSVSYSQLGKTWVVKQMKGFKFILTLCIISNGKEEYSTTEISISDK